MTTGRTLGHILLARLPRKGDDAGSIAMLLMVMVVGAALGGIMMTSIVNQSTTTRFDTSRVHALNAAQTGIDVVLGNIRASTSTTTTSDGVTTTSGDTGKLPCGPWNGAANGGGSATYSATIKYFTVKPTAVGATAMLCTSAGPYSPTANTRTARYALITSTGVDGTTTSGVTKGRTLQTTYVFQTNDVNISGGQIRVFPSATTQWCMDAGTSPAVGTAVVLQTCSTSNPPADQQVWAYRSDLSIELVSSAKKSSSGLCIDTSPTAHAAGDAIVLYSCAVPDASVCPAGYTSASYGSAFPGKTCNVSPYNQQWSVDDNAHLRGATSDQTNTDSYCINAPSQASGIALTLASCAGGVTDTAQTWVPSPTTGAGMAGAGNKQLVNYQQFATCLDVTGQSVSASYLILYTCKQNPNPANVAWNQKFSPTPALTAAPTQTMLTTTTGGTTYCLYSPRSMGGYPVLSSSCPATVAAAANTGYLWTVSQLNATTSSTSQPLAYADRYTVKDASGYCLGPGPNSDLLNGQYYKAVVTTCDGSTAQKWNANPSLDSATLINTSES